jgi:uncharacterized protein
MIDKLHFILYVNDQQRSTTFYKNVLAVEPRLNVPGMTEFEFSNGTILGLMPEAGIKKLLAGKIEDPAKARNIPRAEIYLMVDDPQKYLDRAIANGAKELSRLHVRDWEDEAGYCFDLDSHILAFAKKIDQ